MPLRGLLGEDWWEIEAGIVGGRKSGGDAEGGEGSRSNAEWAHNSRRTTRYCQT
ncbi:hypothetical protein LJC63_05270 [Ruminococcaceae bacterium OttesenSCG-928-L11]|nr:hypothetical protein [Ruminococcaceae bacterium OttesenSCG-928-L11]